MPAIVCCSQCNVNGTAIPSNGSLSYVCIGTAGSANTTSKILPRPLAIAQTGKLYYTSNCTVAAVGAGVNISCPHVVIKTTVEDKDANVLALLRAEGTMRASGMLAAAKPVAVSSIPGGG